MAIFGTKKKSEKTKVTKRINHARASAHLHGKTHEIIRAPWFSEKALLGTDKGVYVFSVPVTATKPMIAAAIKEIYNVSPKKIRTVNLPGARVSMRRRAGVATRTRRRKAYVILNAGDTITLA